jgi:hypothetical protein
VSKSVDIKSVREDVDDDVDDDVLTHMYETKNAFPGPAQCRGT